MGIYRSSPFNFIIPKPVGMDDYQLTFQQNTVINVTLITVNPMITTNSSVNASMYFGKLAS